MREKNNITFVTIPKVGQNHIQKGNSDMETMNEARTEQLLAQIEQEVETGEPIAGFHNGDKDERSIAQVVLELILASGIELFMDQYLNPYARIKTNGHFEIHRIDGKMFKHYIYGLVWTTIGKPLNVNVLSTIIGTLRGKAFSDGRIIELQTRVAWYENAIWYDLGDWRAVKIDECGWIIVDDPPILFCRFPHQRKQVEPVIGGDIRDILKFLNLKEERDEILLLTYLVAVLIPNIPRAILLVHGVQGSAKSTFFKLLKLLIDPSKIEVTSYPREEKEVIQMLAHHYALFIDNLSDLSDWMSDVLCRACTGGGFSKRELYTNDEDMLYYFYRAIGINGINMVASKPDILDRSILFELERIPDEARRTEKELMAEFESVRPLILGSIFTLLSKAISFMGLDEIKLDSKPRLADYAIWCSAVTKAMGVPIETFIKSFNENVKSQNAEAIGASPTAQAIIELMKDSNELIMPAKALLELMNTKDSELRFGWGQERSWPTSANWVWRKIKEVIPNLMAEGIRARYDDKARPVRIITITKLSATASDNDDVDAHAVQGSLELPPV